MKKTEMRPSKYKVQALVPKMPTLEQIAPYIRIIDDNKWYSNFGPLNQLLISRLATYFSVEDDMVCTVANATIGLEAVLSNIEVDRSFKVEVPAFTFSASPASVISSMREVFFIDIDGELRCIPKFNSSLIMDVLPFGDQPRFPSWYEQFDFVIIDGAASFDSLKNIGLDSKFNSKMAFVISLHATKLVGGGEGGVIVSKNRDLIDRIKKWQNFGFDSSDASKRISIFCGTNAKMSEYACAVTLASLDSWDKNRSAYLQLSIKAREICSQFGIEIHPAMKKGLATPNWIIMSKDRTQAISWKIALENAGYESKKWWGEGCHIMEAYASFQRANLTNTESISSRYLGIPFHLYLPDEYWEKMELIFSQLPS